MARPFVRAERSRRAIPSRSSVAQRQQGAILLLATGILVLILAGWLIGTLGGREIERRRDERNAQVLAQAKEALLGFATTYRDRYPAEVFGYLLCPDTNNDGSADPPCGLANEAVVGRLPYRTLGLPDLRDADGQCLWYAISGTVKDNPKPPSHNWDTLGQFGVTTASGATAVGVGGTNTGAVAVIIAPGRPVRGQARIAGTSACGGGVNDFANYLDNPYVFPNTGNQTFVEGTVSSDTNNDRLAWITPAEIFQRVKRRADFRGSPIGHVNDLMAEVAACITAVLMPPYRTDNPSQMVTSNFGSKYVGLIPPSGGPGCPGNAAYVSYWDNWRDQFRYARCIDTSAPCLTVGASAVPNCRGVIVFAGEAGAGQQRFTVAQRQDAANYLEGQNLLVFTNAAAVTLGAETSFAIADPKVPATADVVKCIP